MSALISLVAFMITGLSAGLNISSASARAKLVEVEFKWSKLVKVVKVAEDY